MTKPRTSQAPKQRHLGKSKENKEHKYLNTPTAKKKGRRESTKYTTQGSLGKLLHTIEEEYDGY